MTTLAEPPNGPPNALPDTGGTTEHPSRIEVDQMASTGQADADRTMVIPTASPDPDRTIVIPTASPDPDRTIVIPTASPDPDRTMVIPTASPDPDRTVVIPTASIDSTAVIPTVALGPRADPGATVVLPGSSGTDHRTGPKRYAVVAHSASMP